MAGAAENPPCHQASHPVVAETRCGAWPCESTRLLTAGIRTLRHLWCHLLVTERVGRGVILAEGYVPLTVWPGIAKLTATQVGDSERRKGADGLPGQRLGGHAAA